MIRNVFIKRIEEYVQNNLKAHELEGVEFVEEDYETIYILYQKSKNEKLEDVIDKYMSDVREILDEGLDDNEDEEE